MAPRSVARGVPRSGDRAAAGTPDCAKVHVARQQPATGSHLPLEDTALPFAVSPDVTAARMGRGFAGGLPCQAPSEGERPRAWSEGPCEARDRAAAGMSRRAKNLSGRLRPATGSHLPSEDTALPFAVAPFASSPFAHPIPQNQVAPAEICSPVP
jgi:hypothetical protein